MQVIFRGYNPEPVKEDTIAFMVQIKKPVQVSFHDWYRSALIFYCSV